jgi:topoisomerase IA-like protein
MDGAKEIKCSEFGNEIINWMDKTPAPAKSVSSVKKTVKKAAVVSKNKKVAAKKTASKKPAKKVVVKKPAAKKAVKKK